MNLQHSKKWKTMKQIRLSLETDPVLWPQVPVDLTLDLWLDNAFGDYLKKRGKRGNKDNEGDGPDVGLAALHTPTLRLRSSSPATCGRAWTRTTRST